MDKITIRPSTLNDWCNCRGKWFDVFIKGYKSINSAKAMTGTAIHKAAEHYWLECMQKGEKVEMDLEELISVGYDCFDSADDVQYGFSEDINTCHRNIASGISAWMNQIVPYTDIPKKVEERVSMKIDNHPVVAEVAGTIDYIGDSLISDIKTSSRKYVPSNAVLQQSTYVMLANKCGYQIGFSTIQGIAIKKTGTDAEVSHVDLDIPMAEAVINNILEVLEIWHKDIVSEDVLFSRNPKYFLCRHEFCNSYSTCKFGGSQ